MVMKLKSAIPVALSTLFLLLSLSSGPVKAWWPFSDDENVQEEAGSQKASGSDGSQVLDGLVPFEIKTAEQKFLEEAHQLLKISPLDKCQHKVISVLKKSCGEMTEEELAKMSVQLLNCQAQAEGRQTFPCSTDMGVAECTRPMDAHMWNAYHIISNRARSVCYATRQHQFRIQTETAVNHLAHSAIEQIQAMDSLARSQQEVKQLAEDSMSTIKKEQDQLLERQSSLASTQQLLRNHISDNLHQLAEEKVMIRRGQKELVNTTENIRRQLVMASSILAEQEEQRKHNQAQVSKDLSKLKGDIKDVWARVDNSTAQLLDLLAKMSIQYEATLHNLKTINSTVSQVLQLLDTMNAAVGIQLEWVTQHLGGAQDGLQALTALALHCFFLLLSSLVLLFVKAPWVIRLALLLGVVCNLVAELKFNTSLSLTQLSASVAAILIGNWLVVWWYQLEPPNRSTRYCQQHQEPPPVYSLPVQSLRNTVNSSHNNTTTLHTADVSDTELNDFYMDATIKTDVSGESVASKSSGYSNHTGTPRKCVAITRAGLPCRLMAINGQQYCHRHI